MEDSLPELTDIYALSEWLKRYYSGDKRKPLLITPQRGGLITVKKLEESDALRLAETSGS